MRYLTFTQPEQTSYPVCLLVPMINREEIFKAYMEPYGLPLEDMLVVQLHESATAKKTPAAEIKAWFNQELVETLNDVKVEYLLVADADYFKILTKSAKVDPHLGYVMDCVFGPWKVIYVPNYRAMFYDPEKVTAKIAQGMNALTAHRQGQYETPGNAIINTAAYPLTDTEIKQWLEKLLEMGRPLAIDIEGFGLKHTTCGIGTISFAWTKHDGIAFPVDYVEIEGATEAPFGMNVRNEPRRELLRDFFRKFLKKAMYHSISFDVYILIYQLFMDDILDTEGLLEGLEIMLRNWDCTKLITYLATNSCAGNKLGLKDQAQEFAGNYAMDDIKDITKIPLMTLLQYNLVDSLSTWFTYEKHWDTLVADDQLEIYETIFKPAIIDIVQMQLTGMPVNMQTAIKVNADLEVEKNKALAKIAASPIVQQFTYTLQEEHVAKRNASLKTKQISMTDAETLAVSFNPNSDPQMRALLFEHLGLPVINLTDSKLPSTDGESIEALLNHTKDPQTLELLEAFQMFAIVGTLTSTFMPSILGAVRGPDGWHYLFGNFNLGGTLSGRLSSSGPNLQNLPSTGKGHPIKLVYAKMIKTCFQAPPGWIFAGIDFNSLEDRISALTTKDPNKLKVYTDGYDGHSLRAYAYWPSQMPDIDPNSVESINSIAKKYKPIRDKSKNPTFTLTYQGTKHALMKKYGFTEEQAVDIEKRYHALYQVSDDWVAAKLDEATRTGYIIAAFGLRLRTPLLKQVIRGTNKTPYAAEAEGRTAGNALGQSWCLLNSRAGSEFMGKVRSSPHRTSIRPTAQIHDAGYFLIRDDIEAILYTNKHLVKAVQWQEHPDIAHPEVKLGGELSLFHPDWSKEITIPNGATEAEIFAVIEDKIAA